EDVGRMSHPLGMPDGKRALDAKLGYAPFESLLDEALGDEIIIRLDIPNERRRLRERRERATPNEPERRGNSGIGREDDRTIVGRGERIGIGRELSPRSAEGKLGADGRIVQEVR